VVIFSPFGRHHPLTLIHRTGEPFWLDPARAVRAARNHFAAPPYWRLQLVQDPHSWFNWVMAAIHDALEPVAPRVN
jgi:hypothetical protein